MQSPLRNECTFIIQELMFLFNRKYWKNRTYILYGLKENIERKEEDFYKSSKAKTLQNILGKGIMFIAVSTTEKSK